MPALRPSRAAAETFAGFGLPRFFSWYADLPQTYMVSENENASVLKFGNRYYVKMKSTSKWIPLAQ